MKTALLCVDYTYDFVALDGALTCGQSALDIYDNILRLCDAPVFSAAYLLNDSHIAGDVHHPENKLFPAHNVVGSSGAFPYGKLRDSKLPILPKTRYSAFCGTSLDLLLRERMIHRVALCGVCTDICVLHTAIDAYQLSYEIVVVTDAVATFNPDGHAFALQHCAQVLNASLLTTDEVLAHCENASSKHMKSFDGDNYTAHIF